MNANGNTHDPDPPDTDTSDDGGCSDPPDTSYDDGAAGEQGNIPDPTSPDDQ